MTKILVIGALGQLGSELTHALSVKYGNDSVIATDIRPPKVTPDYVFEILDVMDKEALGRLVKDEKVTQIYHLAAVLSAKGEKDPQWAWRLNMESLLNVLDVSRENKVEKVFWPSSIAVFGPSTPKDHTPQQTIMDPNTVYGISKLAGERWCEYYFEKYGLDVRSVRYPGIISYKAQPGGGTTDYAIDIFLQALKQGGYECFLAGDTRLPMMYIDDAIRGTIELMETPADKIMVRSSYNLGAMSFTPEEVAEEIKQRIGSFEIEYKPDFRQKIADSWPSSIDDSQARNDWNWTPEYDLSKLAVTMIGGIRELLDHHSV
jgi:nucleoside-diphosphate-sugar epimerase